MAKKDDIYHEIKQQFHKDAKKKGNEGLLFTLGSFLLPLIIVGVFIRKPYEYVPDINNLPEPVQIATGGGTTIDIQGEKIYVDFLAEYDIQGRVFSTRNYDDSFIAKTVNKISSRDFVLGRGPVMSKKENIKKFEVDEYLADRQVFVRPKYEYIDWLAKAFNINPWHKNLEDRRPYIITRSNNHPIGSNWKINLLFKKVRVGDAIRLKGYLVYVHPEKGGWHWGPSSLVRDDEGCEIIYVTDITWLKQKK